MYSDIILYYFGEIVWIYSVSIFAYFSTLMYFFKNFYYKLLILKRKKIREFKVTFNTFLNNYIDKLNYNINFLYYFFIWVFLNCIYFFTYYFLELYYFFNLTTFNWIFTIFLIFFICWFIYLIKKLIFQGSIKIFEILLGIFFFFFNIYYYLYINNLVVIIFLFELQSVIFIYLMSILYTNYVNLNLLKTYLNNVFTQFFWYFNSLIFQFWIAFIGVLLFIYGILVIYKFVSFYDWLNLEIFFYFLQFIWVKFNSISFLIVWLMFFLGFLLKIGFFPFFLWKPEIYKNFNVYILFLYMTIYLFFILVFFFVLLNNYLIIIKDIWYIYIYYLYILAMVVLVGLLYIIIDVRSFLAYSSALNLCYILIVLTLTSYNSYMVVLFYIGVYLFYMISFFLFLFLISDNFFWYFTDLQYVNNFLVLLVFFFLFFIGLSGIPPFLGFFAKISVVSILLIEENYFFFILSLLVGLIMAFFYMQNYRFFGFNIKKKLFLSRIMIIKFSNEIMYFNYWIHYFNIFAVIFLADLYIYSSWVSYIC